MKITTLVDFGNDDVTCACIQPKNFSYTTSLSSLLKREGRLSVILHCSHGSLLGDLAFER